MLNCKNKEFTYKIQAIFWDHIEYNIYSGTQKHKYFDWSAESLESSALRDVQQWKSFSLYLNRNIFKKWYIDYILTLFL